MSDSNHSSSLPPSKRFKLHHHAAATTPLSSEHNMKKKKKKNKRVSFQPPSELPAAFLESPCYCLPAKKRVFALPQPFLEYCESTPQPIKPDKPSKEEATPAAAAIAADTTCDEDGDEDGVFCCVCRGTDGDPSDPIVFCDGCDLAVHASCYGNPLIESIPEGDWFCDVCKEGGATSSDIDCYLCPARGGALKRTTAAGGACWAHILCALLVPEVFFLDPVGRVGVDLSRVPVRRWRGRCYLCSSGEGGCVIECSEPNCHLAFHVSCAVDADLCLEFRQPHHMGKASPPSGIVVAFCQHHTLLWRKQKLSGRFTFVPRNQNGKRKH